MRYLLTIIFILSTQLTLAYNNSQASDSLLNLLKSPHSPQQKIQIYRNLADIYLDTSEAKVYLLKMYHEASKIKDYTKMVEALNDILVEEANSNNKDSLIKYIHYLKEMPRPEEVKRLLPLYRMRIFVSQCLTEQKDDAIEKNLHTLDTEENKDNIYNEIASNYTMGVSFYANGKYKEALPYLGKAIKLTESIPSNIKFAYKKIVIPKYCYANAHVGALKESAKVMENLINLQEQDYKENYQNRPFFKIDLYRLQYYSFIISCNRELTLEQEHFYWNQIQQIGKNLTNTIDKYNYYLCANNYYLNNRTKQDYPKAIAANDSLIKFATALGPQNLPGLYNIHSLIHEKLKDYQNALKYLKISHHIQDSLATENTQKQLNELQVRHDINALNNEKAQLEIKNKKILIISLSVLLIVVIGVCSYLYFSLKREKKMKAELKVLNNKAQESERMKQAFINSICHEIRTPLNAIVGFSDLIMNEDIDEELRREFPAEIQKSTVLFTSLVNNMLEVANLDVSEEKLPCELTNIRNICIQEMERTIHKEGINYQLNMTEQAMIIPTNAQYLTLVIEHLLNNANKFTENGQITLGYNLNESEDKIFINVTDTGCGIPKEKYDVVFNRFSKLDTFVPGNGLGLYLCRLIVKRLDGEIKIDSNYKEGTRMIVCLPIK